MKSKASRSRLSIWCCFIGLWYLSSNGFAQQPEPQKLILVAVFSLNFSFGSLQTAEQSWRESWKLGRQQGDFLAFCKNCQNRYLMQDWASQMHLAKKMHFDLERCAHAYSSHEHRWCEALSARSDFKAHNPSIWILRNEYIYIENRYFRWIYSISYILIYIYILL